MSQSKSILFSALITVLLLSSTAVAPSQVGIGINLGPAPICPYGYFDYEPYACAPYGYYGPDWFVGGVFLGAGPWFHGPHGFYGHVDNRYDPHHGYIGPMPERGAHPFTHFQGNEAAAPAMMQAVNMLPDMRACAAAAGGVGRAQIVSMKNGPLLPGGPFPVAPSTAQLVPHPRHAAS